MENLWRSRLCCSCIATVGRGYRTISRACRDPKVDKSPGDEEEQRRKQRTSTGRTPGATFLKRGPGPGAGKVRDERRYADRPLEGRHYTTQIPRSRPRYGRLPF